MASSKIPYDGCIETSFTLGSGVTQWTVNKVLIDPKRKIAHFWLSYYGRMTSGQAVATLPSGYVSSAYVQFPPYTADINGLKLLSQSIQANSADIKISSANLDGSSLYYISLTGEIPLA